MNTLDARAIVEKYGEAAIIDRNQLLKEKAA